MKKLFIEKIIENNSKYLNKNLKLLGWISKKRTHKNNCFFDLVDSTGKIQVVFENKDDNVWRTVKRTKEEVAVKIIGKVKQSGNKIEIMGSKLEIVGKVDFDLSPRPRSDFKIFDRKYQNHVLSNRSYYLRNPKQAAVLSFKSKLLFELHHYFQEKNYTLIDAPVLTEMLLYDDDTAFSFKNNNGNRTWLSQCCTFQLEAAVLAFEKVYNITPSFRAEHSRSNRHLAEYTHLKIELAWADLDDLVNVLGNMIYDIGVKIKKIATKELKTLGVTIDTKNLKPPFKKISYSTAVDILNKNGHSLEWGKSLSTKGEEFLTKYFGNKFIWIQFIPCSAEGFPFKYHSTDQRLTMTSDLIAPFGFGEIGGTAEKITEKKELLERMKEKGRDTKRDLERYSSYINLRGYGIVPHGGIGVGIERLVRYFLKLPHVKDVISYPRLYGRRWNP